MSIIYRQGHQGRLSIQEMDNNFHYIDNFLTDLNVTVSNLTTLEAGLSASLDALAFLEHLDVTGLSASLSALADLEHLDVASLTASVISLKTNLATATASIKILNTNVAGLTASVMMIEDDISNLTDSVVTLSNNLASATASIEALASLEHLDVSGITASILTLNNNVSGITASILTLNNNVAGLTASVITLNTNLASATASIVALEIAVLPVGNVTYLPLTKVGKTQTQIINEAIIAANPGDTLILASGTYNVVASDWDGDADIEAIVIDKAINLVGQGMQSTVITCGTTQSDTIEITSSNVTISNMTIDNTGHDTTAVWVYPEPLTGPSLSGVVIENIRINSFVADGANLGILATNTSIDIHDCEINISTINTSSAGISLYIDPNATATMSCILTNNTIVVRGATALNGGAVFGNEGIRTFCSLNTIHPLNVDMYNVDSRAITVNSTVDYGIRVTSATIGGHTGEAFNATVNAYNCLFSGTTKDVRVYGLSSSSTNVLNLYGSTLVNGTPQGIGGASGAPDGAVNNLGIIAAKGIQLADNASTATAFNVGTMRYRVSGTSSLCEMSMQTGTSAYSWVPIKTNTW